MSDSEAVTDVLLEKQFISRQDAKFASLTRYFTVLPCKHGHVAERGTSDGQCWACKAIKWQRHKEHNLEYARNYSPEKKRLYNKKQRELYPEKHAARNRAWYQKNKVRIQAERRLKQPENYDKLIMHSRKTRLGISFADQESLLLSQNGKCAICDCDPTDRRNRKRKTLSLDHCHMTGQIREFLCSSCNTGIGQLRDDVGLLKSAIKYILKHEAAGDKTS